MAITQGFLLPVTQKDGKQIVIMSPSTEGLNTWFHGAGDDITGSNGRGYGQEMTVKFSGSSPGETREIIWQYKEPIELHDGQGIFTPLGVWDVEDRVSLFSELPATPVTENISGSGNCNLYPIGPGMNIIVPAAGDGGYDVDLATAVPIESSDDASGYWNADYFTGEVTPSETPGSAVYNLLDFSPPSQYFAINMPCGQGHGVLDVDVYKVQWIHQSYKIHLQITKNTPGDGKVAMWLLGFRKYISQY